MKIYINQIPKEGQHLEVSFNPAEMDMERQDIKFIDELHLSGWIFMIEGELILEALLCCPIEFICARCLNPFSFNVSKNLKLTYSLKDRNFIDITEDIRHEVLLEYPISSVCRVDCKGLCKLCGQNLNEGDCECV